MNAAASRWSLDQARINKRKIRETRNTFLISFLILLAMLEYV